MVACCEAGDKGVEERVESYKGSTSAWEGGGEDVLLKKTKWALFLARMFGGFGGICVFNQSIQVARQYSY